MEDKEKKFRLVRFAFETTSEDVIYRHLITEDKLPMLEVNQWLENRYLRNVNTGKEYAKKLVVYLNYLDGIGITYDTATNKHVVSFINYLLYGDLSELRIKSIDTQRVCSTAGAYLTVVTEFYRWLADNYETNMVFKTKADYHRANKSFLYGQIYSYDYKYLIERSFARQRPRREYIKWYSDEEKEALCGGFETLRDEVVFRITLEGFRIDEVLSMKLQHYNSMEQIIQPSRSKGKRTVGQNSENILRTVALPSKLCDLLDRYIQTERVIAENESGIISDYLFINLQKGISQGQPLKYSNYYTILKRCADRVGIDARKIRTHSGRSTKVMEFLEHQATHPEDGITDAIIMESFGWRSPESIVHYRDHNNQVIAKAIMQKLHKKKEGEYDG